MSLTTLLDDLRARGLRLRLVGDEIDAEAPARLLTAAVLAELRVAKPTLVATLRAEDWLTDAQSAIDARLTGATSIPDLESLIALKRAPLDIPPDTELLDGESLGAVMVAGASLTQQIEALCMLVSVLDHRPIDRDRLADLAMREAWRLDRHDLIVQVSSALEEETTR